jgi:predicted nucleic acid-binding protein
VFLPDDLDASALKMPFRNVMGHRQWNDFYLAALSQRHGYRVATFDVGLQGLFLRS